MAERNFASTVDCCRLPTCAARMQLAFEENKHGYEQQTEGKRGELTYPDRFCKRLLRRPCTGWHQRVLRGGCGSQVDWRNGVWMRFSGSTRHPGEEGVLHLVVQARRNRFPSVLMEKAAVQ